MIERYNAILFDFDFTLGDSSIGISESVNHALARMGYEPVADRRIHEMIGLPLKIICQRLTGIEDEATAATFRTHFHELAATRVVESSSLYPGVSGLLLDLKKQGKALGVVSTKSRKPLVDILEMHSIHEHFEVVISGEDVANHKPHPEGLLLAAETINLKPDQILYVGDTILDAEAASAAGMDFVAVLSGTTTCKDFANCTVLSILESVTQL